MAMMGLSKAAILIGAGFTGSILVRNGKLSDLLSELQNLLKASEDAGSDSADFVTEQVNKLAWEIRQLASARPITVVNGGSGEGNITSYLMPAATLGAAGYGYMWWKGVSFSDLMYVTKRNMATAVTSMTKHLEQVSSALAATKRHLTQRIEGLDGKLDEHKLISTGIRDEVTQVRGKLENIGFDLNSLQQIVFSMDGKMNTIEKKQALLCAGILHLCNVFPDKDGKIRELLKEAPKRSNLRYLGSTEDSGQGLKDIIQALDIGNPDNANLEGVLLNNKDSLEIKNLSRSFPLPRLAPFSQSRDGLLLRSDLLISQPRASLPISRPRASLPISPDLPAASCCFSRLRGNLCAKPLLRSRQKSFDFIGTERSLVHH